MEELIKKFRLKLDRVQTDIVREYLYKMNWNNRITGIKGARGTGKTTMLLQHIKLNMPDLSKVLYVSLDDLFFRKTRLYELADQFVKYGGECLVLDEVHRYSTWSEEIKLIYDDLPNLNVIFTGSSIIELQKSKADLSRRAVMFNLNELSFREFLKFSLNKDFKPVNLADLLKEHLDIAIQISKSIKPLYQFKKYLSYGYYPYFMEGVDFYHLKLSEVINQVIENDLTSALDISLATIDKIKSFLMVLAESVPFTPNISKLCERIGVTRNALIDYLYWLQQSRLVLNLHQQGKTYTRMQKPDKIYLNNPNLNYAITGDITNPGTIRETFFANQLIRNHKLNIHSKGDFIIDDKYVFEIGGTGKDFTQIKNIPDSYLALDQIEIGSKNKIPLWLFGFLD